ncbi:DUF4037 domain-containing protein [Leekyejoonella antrihumi]|uniref:DUF4037 domain-containing protein n=1 Tax=Leekyejoonella antrihumi TaxID=1660198 RepID=UPI001FE44703|nr:DUF4037 domain-containing protein [Leekyejoonella antrihumi]
MAIANESCTNGLSLARAYWQQIVAPILDEHRPGIPRAAARIGSGSDVLGLDDQTSRDHDWGLRLQLFVRSVDEGDVRTVLTDQLPAEFAGLPTRFAFTGQDDPVLALDVLTVEEIVSARLGFDPRIHAAPLDWLSLTGQTVLEVTAGKVFEDRDGMLTSLRDALTWYPDDLWSYVAAVDWQRIDQELPIMGRTGDRGDELGSRVIAARLVDIAVHLAFVLCRRWAPYSKWRGITFRGLPLPAEVGQHLQDALAANEWRTRSDHLTAALEALASLQRQVGIPSVDPVCVPFWDRPYLQIDQGLVPRMLDNITDPSVQALTPGLGNIEQQTNNVDLLVSTELRRATINAQR